MADPDGEQDVMARDSGGMSPGSTQAGSFQFARHFPCGVSFHIVPYNFPDLPMCWRVAASLAAGHACVVKPSDKTSLSTLRFMKHFAHLPEGGQFLHHRRGRNGRPPSAT